MALATALKKNFLENIELFEQFMERKTDFERYLLEACSNHGSMDHQDASNTIVGGFQLNADVNVVSPDNISSGKDLYLRCLKTHTYDESDSFHKLPLNIIHREFFRHRKRVLKYGLYKSNIMPIKS